MKKWKINLGLLLALVVCLVMSFMSCKGNVYDDCVDEESDSLTVYNPLTNVLFKSVTDFQSEQLRLQSEEAIKTAFLSMSPQMIERVSKVVLSKHGSATVEDVVTEYKVNYDIYSRQVDSDETPPKKSVVDQCKLPDDTTNFKIEKHEQTSVSDPLLRR